MIGKLKRNQLWSFGFFLRNFGVPILNLYRHNNYVSLLDSAVENKKKSDQDFSFQGLAAASHIQKSYLSKVMHRRAHLSSDQLFSIGSLLGWNREELDYAFLLLEHGRTGITERKNFLAAQIEEIQKSKLETSQYLKTVSPEIAENALQEFYLTPWLQLIHVALAIPRFSESAAKLAEFLRMDVKAVAKALDTLERLGMLEWKDKKCIQKNSNLHLKKSSPFYQAWRNQMRMQSLNRLHSGAREDDYSFSVVLSADPATKRWIQQEFLALLSRAEPRVKKAKNEEVYQMNFDLFSWTEN